MITFELGKKNKINIKCNDISLFKRIRDYFSVPNKGAQFAKKYNKFIPSRKFLITPTGQCDIGMFWEIKNFLLEQQIIINIHIDKQLQEKLACSIKIPILDNLNLKLRDYQYNSVKAALETGRGICVLGTGAGKTLTTATLIECFFNYFKKDKHFKCLVIVPDLSLVNQTYTEFINMGVNFTVTRWTGSIIPDLNSNCIICNISILQSKFDLNEWIKHVDILIVDEAHKIKAQETSKIINNINTIHKFGFTGTLPIDKEDKWSVIGKLGPVLTIKTSAELRTENHLVNAEVKILNLKYKQNYNFKYKDELNFLYCNSYRNNIITKICEKFQNNILILVNHIIHGETLLEYFKNSNKQVFFIRGDVSVDDRDKIKDILEKENNIVCIAISAIFSTGINIKNIHMILFAAGGKSFIRTVQSVGRGLRLHPSKDKLIIIDIQDELKYSFNHGEERKKIYDNEQIPFIEKQLVEI